jgi:hypothetical protein
MRKRERSLDERHLPLVGPEVAAAVAVDTLVWPQEILSEVEVGTTSWEA